MGIEFNFSLKFMYKFQIKFAVLSRAVKETRGKVSHGEVARGYMSAR
jgi:hypothetical protein